MLSARRLLAPLALLAVLTLPAACAAPAEGDEGAGTSGGKEDRGESAWRVREGELGGIHFYEAVPRGHDFDAELPVLVVLHGRGGRAYVPTGPYYVSQPVRLVLPQAQQPLGEGYTWLPVSVTEGKTELLAASLLDVAAQLAAFLEEIVATRPTVDLPVVHGFSQGAMLTFTLAVHHPEIVREALPAAGWLPPSITPAHLDAPRAPRIRAMHGTADPIVTIEPTREAVSRLEAAGFEIELVEFDGVTHEMSPEMHAQLGVWLTEALSGGADAESARP